MRPINDINFAGCFEPPCGHAIILCCGVRQSYPPPKKNSPQLPRLNGLAGPLLINYLKKQPSARRMCAWIVHLRLSVEGLDVLSFSNSEFNSNDAAFNSN